MQDYRCKRLQKGRPEEATKSPVSRLRYSNCVRALLAQNQLSLTQGDGSTRIAWISCKRQTVFGRLKRRRAKVLRTNWLRAGRNHIMQAQQLTAEVAHPDSCMCKHYGLHNELMSSCARDCNRQHSSWVRSCKTTAPARPAKLQHLPVQSARLAACLNHVLRMFGRSA